MCNLLFTDCIMTCVLCPYPLNVFFFSTNETKIIGNILANCYKKKSPKYIDRNQTCMALIRFRLFKMYIYLED